MHLPQIGGEVRALEHWYRGHVRPFLERVEKLDGKPSRTADFDADLDRLRAARSAHRGDLVVCSLGNAGVGKSTLINALVDGHRSVLPHGGIGPLTAQALRVRRGTPTGFAVEYHAPGQLWRLATALEWGFRDELAVRAEAAAGTAPDGPELNEDERSDLEDLTHERASPEGFQEARQAGEYGKKKQDYFAEACEESRRLILGQLKTQLEKAWASGRIQAAQAQVIDNVLATLEIQPVSAVEYARAVRDDPDDRSFRSRPELSNIPRFLESLGRQAGARREAEDGRVREVLAGVRSRLDATLSVIRAQWMEDRRASEEAARLREEFLVFIEPLRGEYQVRQGAYREFLRETPPRAIRTEIGKAASAARRELRAYLDELRIVHYKTLQAAVRKGGTFVGGVGRKNDAAPREDLRRFLEEQAGAVAVEGCHAHRFVDSDAEGRPLAAAVGVPVLRLADGELYLVPEYDGIPVVGPDRAPVKPLGLNIPAVAESLRKSTFAPGVTGAAHLRWSGEKPPAPAGRTFGVQVLVRQTVRFDGPRCVEQGATLHVFHVAESGEWGEWVGEDRRRAIQGLLGAVLRREPAPDGPIDAALSRCEAERIRELRMPTPAERESHRRHAVLPLLAAVVTNWQEPGERGEGVRGCSGSRQGKTSPHSQGRCWYPILGRARRLPSPFHVPARPPDPGPSSGACLRPSLSDRDAGPQG